MGFKVRRSIKVAPGVRVNFGKKSASVSVGGKYGRITKSTTGRTTVSARTGIKGVSYSKTISGATPTKKKENPKSYTPIEKSAVPKPQKKGNRLFYWISIICGAGAILDLLTKRVALAIIWGIISVIFFKFYQRSIETPHKEMPETK